MAVEATEITVDNLVTIDSMIFIGLSSQGDKLGSWGSGGRQIPWIKYSIKETDMRVKTASFVTPTILDLTEGVHAIKIVSSLHENFTGFILSDEFTENKDGTYTYQCQDMSRQYQSKFDLNLGGNVTVHRALKYLLTKGGIPLKGTITAAKKKEWGKFLAGLRESGKYDQSLWGNYLNINTMTYKPKMLIRNKSVMEVIRDLTIGYMRYVDVYFDDNGLLQIKPFSVKDWKNSGLFLTVDETSSRKFKFDKTNAITGAVIQSTEQTKLGTVYTSQTLTGLNLAAFMGSLNSEVSNPDKSSKTSSGSSTTNAAKNTKDTSKKTTTKTSTMKNPFNNKSKKILVSADGGSGTFKNKMVELLKKDGWSVTDLGVGPGTHSTSYNKLDKKYAVNLTIYNGADPETIKEPVTGWLKGKHEKYGVRLVQMFDTSSWTNPKGMKPYRYGDFKGYTCHKAWDDNYSGKSDAQAKIKDLGAWYNKYYSKVVHVCGPSAKQAFTQFNAGGYFKSKGIK